MAVTCGFSVRCAKITTVGNLLVAANVGPSVAASVAGNVVATVVGGAVRLGTSPRAGDGVLVAVGTGVDVLGRSGGSGWGRVEFGGGTIVTRCTRVSVRGN